MHLVYAHIINKQTCIHHTIYLHMHFSKLLKFWRVVVTNTHVYVGLKVLTDTISMRFFGGLESYDL